MWNTADPFLFCAHHKDHYPRANESMGPDTPLTGRHLGQDFTIKDGWRMYHGTQVPGFPAHPHRGFETVTIVMEGFVDHSDSHGAAGRYGEGDVQWMTAGAGLQHAEMFPLLNKNSENPLELFQVWLNLPAKDKFVNPYYKMLWSEDIPVVKYVDENGKTTQITLIAGSLNHHIPPAPAPDSWAAKYENEVSIQLIRMESGSKYAMKAASAGLNRTLYFYQGNKISIAGIEIPEYHSVSLLSDYEIHIDCAEGEALLLLLQGRPINETVAKYGPFVMNTMEEINTAISDYRISEFGGWPWKRHDNVHPPDSGRFARYSDGREEFKP
jgi:quercetin 2,3-dioxygenase